MPFKWCEQNYTDHKVFPSHVPPFKINSSLSELMVIVSAVYVCSFTASAPDVFAASIVFY